jgi:hypothetical protein
MHNLVSLVYFRNLAINCYNIEKNTCHESNCFNYIFAVGFLIKLLTPHHNLGFYKITNTFSFYGLVANIFIAFLTR